MGAGCSTAGAGILSDIHHRIQCAWFISLARGTLTVAPLRVGDGRFIPAGAGTQRTGICRQFLYRFIPAGAGTHNSQINIYFVRRFILAGAGNTIADAPGIARAAVYPRWRGNTLSIHNCFKQIYSASTIYQLN